MSVSRWSGHHEERYYPGRRGRWSRFYDLRPSQQPWTLPFLLRAWEARSLARRARRGADYPIVFAYLPLLRIFLAAVDCGDLSRTLRISLTRSSGKHGFVTNASHPAFMAPSEMPASACPVRATTGMLLVRADRKSTRLNSSHQII